MASKRSSAVDIAAFKVGIDAVSNSIPERRRVPRRGGLRAGDDLRPPPHRSSAVDIAAFTVGIDAESNSIPERRRVPRRGGLRAGYDLRPPPHRSSAVDIAAFKFGIDAESNSIPERRRVPRRGGLRAGDDLRPPPHQTADGKKFQQGGGWCNDMRSCLDHMKTRRGSSNYMDEETPFKGIMSNKPEENPDFYNWYRVKIRYCDGASFLGEGYDKALLAGCSTDGLASIQHCDEFRALFPTSTKSKCFADAGLFLDAELQNLSLERSLIRLGLGVAACRKKNRKCNVIERVM